MKSRIQILGRYSSRDQTHPNLTSSRPLLCHVVWASYIMNDAGERYVELVESSFGATTVWIVLDIQVWMEPLLMNLFGAT